MSLAYVVDTDWIIDHFNGMEQITGKLDEMRPAGLAISVVSLAERYPPVVISSHPWPPMAAIELDSCAR